MAREIQVTFDAHDPTALAGFWATALDYQVQSPPEGFDSWDGFLDANGVPPERRNDASALVDPDGSGPRLYFQRVPEGKKAKNRVHLDVRCAPGLDGPEREQALRRQAEVLVAAGARVHRVLEPTPSEELCIVMQDPEGNEFCLD